MAAYGVWMLGYPEQAQRMSQDAIALAQELAHAFSVAFAFVFAADLSLHCRAYSRTQEYADTALRLSAEVRFAYSTNQASIFHGGALAAQDQPREGIVQIRHGLEAQQAIAEDAWCQPHYLAVLTDAYRQAAQTAEGLRTVAEALAIVNKTEERWHEAELYRLQGELLLQQSPKQQTEAAGCFQQAIEIAQKQEAKSWELRAATNLARLWQQQGKTAEARELLAPVYGWFTEGFNTADLKDAKALLEQRS